MENVNIKNRTKRDEDVSISMNKNSIVNKLRKDIGSYDKGSPSIKTLSKTSDSSTFCSDICFSKYRRANFQSKRCDWCHHIKSSVNCIDLQDGDNQYQFCSDKCLNQFKLDIFCQETKEHLDMHPYHRDQLQQIEDDSSASLITPDLWLKNCSTTRSSTRSETPSLTNYVSLDIGGTSSESFCTNVSYSLSSQSNFLLRNKETIVKKMLKRTTKKKKNRLKMRNLLNSEPGKQDGSFSVVQEETPKIFFRPHSSNTTTVPSNHISSHQSVSLSQSLSPLHAHRIQKVAQKNCLANNLPVPPLLPINVSSEFSSQPSSTNEIKTTPVHHESLPTTSLIPPPMLLIPYPIILPVFLPIPIPIPVPIAVTKNNPDKESDLTTKI